MKKYFKLLPGLLLLVLTLGVLGFGIYASRPATNTIGGTLKINAAGNEVELEVYKDSVLPANKLGDTVTTRKGASISLAELQFDSSDADSASEVDAIDLIIKITNKSLDNIGVYFWDGLAANVPEEVAAANIIYGHHDINGTGAVSNTAYNGIVDAEYSFYHEINGYTVSGNERSYSYELMHVVFTMQDLATEDVNLSYTLNLNVEKYNPSWELENVDPGSLSANSTYDPSAATGFVKIPSGTATVPVYGNETAASANTDITHVVVPQGTELSTADAFYNCSELEVVTLPSTLTTIGNNSFNGCTDLETVVLPAALTTVGTSAFSGCTGLTEITIPSNVTTIGESAFAGCSNLTDVYIESSTIASALTRASAAGSILDNATSVSILSGLTAGSYIAENDNTTKTAKGKSYTSYVIPVVAVTPAEYFTFSGNAVTGLSLQGRALCDAGELTEIVIPSSYSIGSSSSEELVFYDFYELMNYCWENGYNFTFDYNNVTYTVQSENDFMDYYMYFNEMCYYGPGSITITVTITLYVTGDDFTVTSIGSGAFDSCSGLTSIIIPYGVTSIGDNAFKECAELISITIPGSVTNIDGYAFHYCTSLTSIDIPDSVTSIGEDAFNGCSGLTSVKVDQLNTAYYDGNGNAIIRKSDNCLIAGCMNTVIPNTVISIGSFAFVDCVGLTLINIPDSVVSIGDFAFIRCSSLTSINISSSVTSIGSYVFAFCSGVASITVDSNNTVYEDRNSNAIINKSNNSLIVGCKNTLIPNSVTMISSAAFRGCSNLTSITIPDSVTSIGMQAFEDCSGLTSINIPNGVTSIGMQAFWGCSGLTSITIPSSVTSIGGSAFSGCSSLTSITIPSSVTSIGNSAFQNCTGLEEITINANISSFSNAFSNAGASTGFAVNIGGSMTSIPQNMFYNKSNLLEVNIGNGVTSIGSGAFRGCSGLTSITIPSSVTSIGSSAFWGCSGLTSITIPSSVTSVGGSAFKNCTGLEEITINANIGSFYSVFPNAGGSTGFVVNLGGSMTSIPQSMFAGISNLLEVNIGSGVTSIGSSAFASCEDLTSITIPSSVTSIGDGAFRGCSGLTSITIPSSVTSIGDGAFQDCYKLVEVYNLSSTLSIEKNSTNNGYAGYYALDIYTSASTGSKIIDEGGLRYYKQANDNYYLLGFVPGSTLTSITSMNSNTKQIYQYAFYKCKNLSSITIPNTVISIGSYAFCLCTNISSITISSSVINICDNAFNQCTGLTSIAIPDGVTSIGYGAFSYCSSLTSINIPGSVTSIGDGAFSGCRGLTLITVDSGNTIYEDRNSNAIIKKSDNCLIVGCKNTVIPNSVTSIGSQAFDECSGLTSIIIPSSVTRLDFGAFRGCRGLTSITIPSGVTSIESNAFFGCTSLATVYVDSSTIAAGLSSVTEYGRLIYYATTIYIKSDLTPASYITDGVAYTSAGQEVVGGVTYNKYVRN